MTRPATPVLRKVDAKLLIDAIPPNNRLVTLVTGTRQCAAAVSSLTLRQPVFSATGTAQAFPPRRDACTPTRMLQHLASTWRVGGILVVPHPAASAAHELERISDFVVDEVQMAPYVSMVPAVSRWAPPVGWREAPVDESRLRPGEVESWLSFMGEPEEPSSGLARFLQMSFLSSFPREVAQREGRVRDMQSILSMTRAELRTFRPAPVLMADKKKKKKRISKAKKAPVKRSYAGSMAHTEYTEEDEELEEDEEEEEHWNGAFDERDYMIL